MDDPRIEALRDLRVAEVDLADIAAGAIDAYEERLRVNVGLVAENAKLRRQLGLAPAGGENA